MGSVMLGWRGVLCWELGDPTAPPAGFCHATDRLDQTAAQADYNVEAQHRANKDKKVWTLTT